MIRQKLENRAAGRLAPGSLVSAAGGTSGPSQLTGLIVRFIACIALAWCCPQADAQTGKTINLSVRDTEVSEVMEMLSRQERVNILLAEGVTGKISVNLYDVQLDDAIRSIANSAGYELEKRGSNYFIIERDDVGKYADNGTTRVQAFRLRYVKAENVSTILENQISRYGSITALPDRNVVVVKDTPEFLQRIEAIIASVDYRPKQVLIEARILEITLDESEAYGIEWARIFESGEGVAGTRGLSAVNSGFFIEFVGEKLEVFLDMLEQDGRTKTLSTPKLLTLENKSASVIVGDRLGYINTVTINQVTTETTEFLESGVILQVTPSVDDDGRIMLDIHPEISTGTVTDGVPSQTTTSVTTHLLVPSGGTSLIGGLIKSQTFVDNQGVPVLRKIPIAGKLFSRREERNVNTEIIVLITPTIVEPDMPDWQQREMDLVEEEKANSVNHLSNEENR